MQRRIVFGQSLLNGVAHDVAKLLPGTGRNFQKAFVLDNSQQRSEMLRFQHRNGLMTNRRKNMIFHTGEDAICIVSRPLFVGFVPASRYGFKAFFRRSGDFFGNTLLYWINILRQKFTNTVVLLAGVG
ncbi:hypothetical protein GCM10007905_36590 [Mixta theicola]|nr:hypothetical protein GCM10007905_36590 [Mixta theicola]